MSPRLAKTWSILSGLVIGSSWIALASPATKPTLYLIGDSTVRNNTGGLQGWGDPIKPLFDAERIQVENRALGGRSSRTFLTEGLWNKVRNELKPGDFVIIQFGHNDGGSLTQNRARGSLKGTDDRTEEVVLTNGNAEVVHTFGWYLRKYVSDSKACGATPIICSLIPRNDWQNGRILRGTNSYEFFASEVAHQEGVGYVNLHEIIARKYEAEGKEAVTRKYFLNEHTHTTPAGAALNAACVVEGLRSIPNCSLVAYLRAATVLNQSASSSDRLPAFLFSYFTGNGEDGLHLAWSRDGYKWTALRNGQSFLKPEVGESKLMRDPCLLLGPDGTFHLVWTTAWQGRTIGHASSKDLIHWSPQQAIPVMAQEPAAINCWAPEIAWDTSRHQYLICWATTITNRFLETAGAGDERYNHRIYATTTEDFHQFTPAKLLYDPGFNVIDATILPANGKFYLIIKDETRNPVRKHLRIASGDDIAGPYADLSAPFTRDWVEGPTALWLGNAWIVYFDAYRDHRYEAVLSTDLRTWQDVSPRISFPAGTRHGTALAIGSAFLDTLLMAAEASTSAREPAAHTNQN